MSHVYLKWPGRLAFGCFSWFVTGARLEVIIHQNNLKMSHYRWKPLPKNSNI